MSITLIESKQIKQLAELAYDVWHEYFPCILSVDQIDYMVDKFQSERAIESQINDGYEYYFIENCAEKCGYFCIKNEKKRLFLSKFYIKKEARGKKLASEAFKYITEYCRQNGINNIYLHVNKYNINSIEIYKHLGFEIDGSDIGDIGNGYVMDDYIMSKNI